MTRRQWFQAFSRRITDSIPDSGNVAIAEKTKTYSRAIIKGRNCLAYQNSFCTTCAERCPEAGAITVCQGVPQIQEDKCTGCGICHDVCPAPLNAILLL